MKLQNWKKIEEILIAAEATGEEDDSVIGLSILDTQEIKVIKMNDYWVLADRDTTCGRFHTQADAWAYIARVCKKAMG